eukprot:6491022-Amphidinium_carterae.2
MALPLELKVILTFVGVGLDTAGTLVRVSGCAFWGVSNLSSSGAGAPGPGVLATVRDLEERQPKCLALKAGQ